MSIGAGIAIAGAFIGTALAFVFGTNVPGEIFLAPGVVGCVIAVMS